MKVITDDERPFVLYGGERLTLQEKKGEANGDAS